MADKKFESLEEAIAYIKEQNEKLTSANASKKAAEDALKIANEELENAKAENQSSIEIIAELGKKLHILENNKEENTTIVELDGKHYKLLGNRFIVKGEELNAEQLSKNTAELERMVKIKSGSLVEITE